MLFFVIVNGGLNDQGNPGTEAALDIQYTVGLTYPTTNIFYSTPGSPPFTPDQGMRLSLYLISIYLIIPSSYSFKHKRALFGLVELH